MDMVCCPAALKGSVEAPPSKSASHRAVICAALARGETLLENISFSQDIEATLNCVQALGAQVEKGNDWVKIQGIRRASGQAVLPCGESGSTLRFFIPIAGALGCKAAFTGEGKLPSRPIAPLVEAMTPHGIAFDYQNTMPFSISGRMTGGDISIAGDISSQYLTGLLFAAPLLEGDNRILLTTRLASRPYVEMTLEMMRAFGVQIEDIPGGWSIPGRQRYQAKERYGVERDCSNGAFFLTAGAVGREPVTVTGLNPRTAQGDREIIPLLERFGAKVERQGERVTVSPSRLKAIRIDGEEIPDLVPVLCVAASYAEGTTEIYHVGRLRLKESDRLSAMADCLRRLGGRAQVGEDSILVTGAPLHGGTVSGYNDHRIVMSMAIAALGASGPVTVQGVQAVRKSYPNFFEDYQKLGGNCHAVSVE